MRDSLIHDVRFEYEQPTGLYLILTFAVIFMVAVIVNACLDKKH